MNSRSIVRLAMQPEISFIRTRFRSYYRLR